MHYFFKSKNELFASAVELPVSPERLQTTLEMDPKHRGEQMARLHLESLFAERSQSITAMIRAAVGDPDAAPALRNLIEKTLVTGAAQGLSGRDARLRAELAGAQMVGLFIVRYLLRIEPLASLPLEELVARIAPALDAVLSPEESA